MAIVQTTYRKRIDDYVEGQVIRSTPHNIDSVQLEVLPENVLAEDSGGHVIGFGQPVTWATPNARPLRQTGVEAENFEGRDQLERVKRNLEIGTAGEDLNRFRGITVLDKTVYTPTARHPINELTQFNAADARLEAYKEDDILGVMTMGDIVVRCSTRACVTGNKVFVEDNSGTIVGGQAHATHTSGTIPGAFFLTSASAGGLAIVRLTGVIK